MHEDPPLKTTVRALRLALPLLTVLALGACGGSDPTFPPEFDASLGIDLASMTKTPSGLYYKDLVVGTGAAAATGSTTKVTYSGWLSSGTRFDSGTISITLGTTRVIDGFAEGVTGMKVGGKRKLVIPPELGYGKNGNAPIPGNATLIFDVELLEVS